MTTPDFSLEQPLDFEAWQAFVRSHCGGFNAQRGDRGTFAGTLRPRRIGGFKALELTGSVAAIHRTLRDARRDGVDDYALYFVTSGQNTLVQNDPTIVLSAGGCALVDVARPVSFVANNDSLRSVALTMPRPAAVSRLGLEPEGSVSWDGAVPAVRLLSRLILDSPDEYDTSCAAADHYMQLAVCDLLGAMLASSDRLANSSHNEKIFARACKIAKDHFTNPNIRPRDVASEAGISLRYLQKLFTARGTTCSRYVQGLRLNQAARLLRLRKMTGSAQPLSDIAFASGFQDYANFSRTFRSRFGHSPGAETGAAEGGI